MRHFVEWVVGNLKNEGDFGEIRGFWGEEKLGFEEDKEWKVVVMVSAIVDEEKGLKE